jgi:hypothetical protein
MPRPLPPETLQTMQLVSANFARLSAIIPQLGERFFIAGSARAVENVWRTDWALPPRHKLLKIVRWHEDLAGVDGQGRVLWHCYAFDYSLNASAYNRIFDMARYRGFEIKSTTEYPQWLTNLMQSYLQVLANDGSLAPAPFPRKPL